MQPRVIRFPEDLAEKISKFATEHHMSFTDAVRFMCSEFLVSWEK